MMNEEPIRLMAQLAIGAQGGGDALRFLAAVREHEAFLATRMLEDIAIAWIGHVWRDIGWKIKRMLPRSQLFARCELNAFSRLSRCGQAIRGNIFNTHNLDIVGSRRHEVALRSLRPRSIEVLHRNAPGTFRLIEARNDGLAIRARRKQGANHLRVTDRRRKAHAPWVGAGKARKTLDKAQGLAAPVPAQKRVHFVDDDIAQVAEHLGKGRMLVNQHALERFGGDLQNARGMLYQASFVRSGYIAVPTPHWNISLLAQLV